MIQKIKTKSFLQKYDSDINTTKNTSPLDYVFLMALFIVATHYIITIPKKLK